MVLQLQAGSLDALGGLYDRYNRLVYRTALAISGDAEAAADLLQDVFLRLFRFARRVQADRPLEPWLYRVTTNLAYTYVKRQRWQQPLEDLAEWISGEGKSQPPQIAESREQWLELEQAIQSLPFSQRVVIVLHYINECSLEEVSQIVGVPTGTVKSRLHYARESLKKQLGAQDGPLAEAVYEFT